MKTETEFTSKYELSMCYD